MPTPQFWAPFQEQSCQTVTEREFTRTAHLIIPILFIPIAFSPPQRKDLGSFSPRFFLLTNQKGKPSERARAEDQQSRKRCRVIIKISSLALPFGTVFYHVRNILELSPLPSCPHSTTDMCYEMLSVLGEPLPVQESHEEGPSLPYCAGNANTAARSLAVPLISFVARSPARHFFAC